MKQIGHQLGWHLTLPCHNNQISTHIKLTELMKHIHPYKHIQTNNTQIRLIPTSMNPSLNFKGIKLNWHIEHKHLHQQTTDALNNIAKSSSLQENLHFNDIPIFKAKDPPSFDEWLEQIDKVTSLTSKAPINSPLQSLKALLAELSVNIHPLWDGTK